MIHSAEQFQVRKVTLKEIVDTGDMLAVEEPLEIRIVSGPNREEKTVSITMRTPGNDDELAAGFLFTEGIITQSEEIQSIGSKEINITTIDLAGGVSPSLKTLDRHFYTTSSCGVCGKTSLDAVKMKSIYALDKSSFVIPSSFLNSLQQKLQGHQKLFDITGGLHASALFDSQGELILIREDVGRHNALDKVIGAKLLQNKLPLFNHVLLLSGRISFELVQKAFMAGIPIVAAIGAPSSLAVTMAEECGMTLVGFLRDNRFTIYTGKQRIEEDPH
jgi:FdhD protein